MKNNLIILILLFLPLLNLNAQEKLSKPDQDLLREKVRNSAKNTQSILSDFVQEKYISALNNVVKSEGKMAFLMPDKIKWEYISPEPSTAIFRENTLFVDDQGKKNSFDLDSNKLFKSFKNLMVSSIKGDMFDETQFEIYYYRMADDYLVRFVPKEKRLKKMISSFELKFDKHTAEVKEVKLIEGPDDYTIIRFLNRKTNLPVSDSIFQQ